MGKDSVIVWPSNYRSFSGADPIVHLDQLMRMYFPDQYNPGNVPISDEIISETVRVITTAFHEFVLVLSKSSYDETTPSFLPTTNVKQLIEALTTQKNNKIYLLDYIEKLKSHLTYLAEEHKRWHQSYPFVHSVIEPKESDPELEHLRNAPLVNKDIHHNVRSVRINDKGQYEVELEDGAVWRTLPTKDATLSGSSSKSPDHDRWLSDFDPIIFTESFEGFAKPCVEISCPEIKDITSNDS